VENVSPGDVSPAELLPAVYRAVLDRVSELERRGERGEAGRLRTEAIRAYSRAWDAEGRRRLESVLRRADRLLAIRPGLPAEAAEPVPAAEPSPPADADAARMPDLAQHAPDPAPHGPEPVKRRLPTAV